VIDLGPGGGVNGGEIVAEGTPEAVAANKRSFTGQYLKETLAKAPRSPAQAGVQAKRKTRRRPAASGANQPDLIAAK
jgi:excinuclease ABC subunit A